MEHTIIITAGRNIQNRPMGRISWEDLNIAIEETLASHRATIFTNRAIGSGEWEGVKEESASYVAQVDQEAISQIQERLATLAHAYEQDAIFLGIIGESYFCS
jgi:hypothetical protein